MLSTHDRPGQVIGNGITKERRNHNQDNYDLISKEHTIDTVTPYCL